MSADPYLVVPGQVIAVMNSSNQDADPLMNARRGGKNDEDDGENEDIDYAEDSSTFLRGHGTYLEQGYYQDDRGGGVVHQTKLIASVCGMVQRVNKLISVQPIASELFVAHVGDFVIGRVVQIIQQSSAGTTTSSTPNTPSAPAVHSVSSHGRWKIQLSATTGLVATLPLQGMNLAGDTNTQRMRTDDDVASMRAMLGIGDLVACQVHKIQHSDHSIVLHTPQQQRSSHGSGKLEHGMLVTVPPALIARRKNHVTYVLIKSAADDDCYGRFLILWGCNGMVWVQLHANEVTSSERATILNFGGAVVVEANVDDETVVRSSEAPDSTDKSIPYSVAQRRMCIRVRNCIECLRMVAHPVMGPEDTVAVYRQSLRLQLTPNEMLQPQNVIQLTKQLRPQ
jgi:exosome complex component RRP4